MVSPNSSSPDPAVEVQVAADFDGLVDVEGLRTTALATLAAEGQVGAGMTLVVTSDAQVQELNARFRNVDEATDVLAFPSEGAAEGLVEPPEAAQYLGDVIIAYPRAAAQAEAAGHAVAEELRLLVVHAALHLLGYDHASPSEEAAMWGRQEEILVDLPPWPRNGGTLGAASSHRMVGDSIGVQFESRWRSDLPTSFRHALAGLGYVLRTQRNARIHVAVALVAMVLAAVVHLSLSEWAILVLTIGFVFVAEMFNSVAEVAVDAVTQQFHPMAKAAKDVAAGAVILAAIISLVVGLLLFGPRLWALSQPVP